jgi:hypothetical protein
MSDQVIFTKDELEKIEQAIRRGMAIKEMYSHRPDFDLYSDAIAILDSPRPRPEVPLEMLHELVIGYSVAEWKRIFSKYGIDVES